jgi:ribosomal protein S17E
MELTEPYTFSNIPQLFEEVKKANVKPLKSKRSREMIYCIQGYVTRYNDNIVIVLNIYKLFLFNNL